MITIDDLAKSRMRTALHVRLAKGGSHYVSTCVEYPRLTRAAHRPTRRHDFTHQFYVDKFPVKGTAEIVAALNRTTEENDAMAEQLALQGGSAQRKWTIKDGIDELTREQRQRARVYPRLVDGGKLDQAEADAQNAALAGTLRLLEFCFKHEHALREFMAQAVKHNKEGAA